MQQSNAIPSVGTVIPIEERAVVLSRDQKTHVCRIKYKAETGTWSMVPARTNSQGALINHGLLVFLNSRLDKKATHIRITSIQPTGKGAYADPVQV
jgi:hypothetical protein